MMKIFSDIGSNFFGEMPCCHHQGRIALASQVSVITITITIIIIVIIIMVDVKLGGGGGSKISCVPPSQG